MEPESSSPHSQAHATCQTLSTTVIKSNHLMIYKAKVAVCSEVRTKHSKKSEHSVGIWNVKPDGTLRNR
jgi:hypothetical protein